MTVSSLYICNVIIACAVLILVLCLSFIVFALAPKLINTTLNSTVEFHCLIANASHLGVDIVLYYEVNGIQETRTEVTSRGFEVIHDIKSVNATLHGVAYSRNNNSMISCVAATGQDLHIISVSVLMNQGTV